MTRSLSVFVFAVAVSFAHAGVARLASAAPATAPTTLPSAPAKAPPAEVLGIKGLSKGGTGYALPAEKEVVQEFKNVLAAKKKLDEETRARRAVEREIKKAKDAISGWEYERRGLLQKLAGVKTAVQNNNIVAQIEALQSKMKEGVKYIEEQEGKLAKIGDDARTAYVNAVLDLQAKVDKVQGQYALLAADAQTKAAAEALKVKYGPSAEFNGQVAQLKRLRSQISSETIPVTMEGLVPHVDVTINGVTRSMVFDSGASLICIPAELAKTLELIPPDDAPTLRLTLADGKQVQAKMMILKTVRVGTFTVEEVECAILPADLTAAQPLLGGSFLRHFIYRLDPQGRVLKLSKVVSGDAKETKPEPAKKPGK